MVYTVCTGQKRCAHLITGQYAEAVNDLLGSISIRALPRHEVQECIEMHVSGVVRIHGRQYPLEVDLPLPVLADRVAQRHQARLELVRRQAAGPVLVKVVERRPELVELLLRDALRVSGQDLVFNFVDVAVYRRQQLLPAHAQRFHCVLGISEINRKNWRMTDALQKAILLTQRQPFCFNVGHTIPSNPYRNPLMMLCNTLYFLAVTQKITGVQITLLDK